MGQDATGHWYPWLKAQLEARGYMVWVPNLPTAQQPDATQMTDFLLARTDWDWSDNLVVGHSSGAVEIMQLLPRLQKKVDTAVLIGAFDSPLWPEEHKYLFKPAIDYDAVKRHVRHAIVLHGEDDPWCPVDGAKRIADSLDAELIIIHGAGHFSTSLDQRWIQIPELVQLLTEREAI